MPLTVSHIAAVLPFQRVKYFSFTGLIIGSMAPDFEYILRMTLYGHYGHTWPGLLFFDLPVSIAIYLLYQSVIRAVLINHLPGMLYARLHNFVDVDWKGYLKAYPLCFLFSVFIGILTHFLWDGLTHGRNYDLANHLTFLLIRIPIGRYAIPVHSIFQGISSIVGLAILWWYLWQMPAQTEITTDPEKVKRYWWRILILTVFIFCVRLFVGIPNEKLIGQLIVIGMSAVGLSITIISFIYKIYKLN